MLFVAKMITALLLMPSSIGLGLIAVGAALFWLRRRALTAKIALTVGFLLLAALSVSAITDRVIKPLELWYPQTHAMTG